MTGPVIALVASGLVVATLLWPPRSRSRTVAAMLRVAENGAAAADVGSDRSGPRSLLRQVWREDPVVLWRRWRADRRPADLEGVALALLDASAPALAAGLTPRVALQLAAAGPPGARSSPLQHFLDELESVSSAGQPSSRAWFELAERSGSRPLAFVAGAWRLSETTGAPLAMAVERAAAGLRDSQTRRRRVAVAVAGPRATVFVLTALPLTGPLFGLACGVSPSELYLGSPLSVVSVAVGSGLVALGRRWCRRLVCTAVES